MGANQQTPKQNAVAIRLSSGAEEVRCVLNYEAIMRYRNISQTAYELVMEAVDRDAYPEDVLRRLDELQEGIDRRAAEAALAGGGWGSDG